MAFEVYFSSLHSDLFRLRSMTAYQGGCTLIPIHEYDLSFAPLHSQRLLLSFDNLEILSILELERVPLSDDNHATIPSMALGCTCV